MAAECSTTHLIPKNDGAFSRGRATQGHDRFARLKNRANLTLASEGFALKAHYFSALGCVGHHVLLYVCGCRFVGDPLTGKGPQKGGTLRGFDIMTWE